MVKTSLMSVSYPAKQDGKGIPDVTVSLPAKQRYKSNTDVSLLPRKIKIVKAAMMSVSYPAK